MTTPTQPPNPTPAEVEAALYVAVDAFVSAFLTERGYKPAQLGVVVNAEEMRANRQLVGVFLPRLIAPLEPLPAPPIDTPKAE